MKTNHREFFKIKYYETKDVNEMSSWDSISELCIAVQKVTLVERYKGFNLLLIENYVKCLI